MAHTKSRKITKFYKIYLELSDICHLNCSFCPPQKSIRGLMPLSLFDEITSQIRNKTRFISLHVLGDPLCVSNLCEYLDILESKNMRLDIVSSGVFLREKHFKILLRKNVHQISFSLDSIFDSNNRFGGRIDKNRYFERIFELYKCVKNSPFRIYLNLRLFNVQHFYNGDMAPILERFSNYCVQDSRQDSMKNSRHRIRLQKDFFIRFHSKFEWADPKKANSLKPYIALRARKAKDSQTPHCLGSISQLGILSNGTLVPCCLDASGALKLGDFRKQSFKEILESRTFLDFRKAQIDSKSLPEICQYCTFHGV